MWAAMTPEQRTLLTNAARFIEFAIEWRQRRDKTRSAYWLERAAFQVQLAVHLQQRNHTSDAIRYLLPWQASQHRVA